MTLGGKVYETPLPGPKPITQGNGLVKVLPGEGQFGVDLEWALPPGATVLSREDVAARDQLGADVAEWLVSASRAIVRAALHGDAVALDRVADALGKYGLPPIPRTTGAGR